MGQVTHCPLGGILKSISIPFRSDEDRSGLFCATFWYAHIRCGCSRFSLNKHLFPFLHAFSVWTATWSKIERLADKQIIPVLIAWRRSVCMFSVSLKIYDISNERLQKSCSHEILLQVKVKWNRKKCSFSFKHCNFHAIYYRKLCMCAYLI